MAVFRINKTTDYTVMSNTHFKEREMSLKAKGLLSLMLSLPDDWDYSIAGLEAICKENETAIKTALNELRQFGYVNIVKLMPNQTQSGRIEYMYNIFETPHFQAKEKQGIEKLPLEFQPVEKQGQLNTNKSNTNRLNTDNKKERRKQVKKPTSYDEILSTITDEPLRETYYEYIKMRKLIKSPMTDKALTMLINKVNKLEPSSVERQKQLLENAIMNNWKSVYPLRDDNNNGKFNNKNSNKQEYSNPFLQMLDEMEDNNTGADDLSNNPWL